MRVAGGVCRRTRAYTHTHTHTHTHAHTPEQVLGAEVLPAETEAVIDPEEEEAMISHLNDKWDNQVNPFN